MRERKKSIDQLLAPLAPAPAHELYIYVYKNSLIKTFLHCLFKHVSYYVCSLL